MITVTGTLQEITSSASTNSFVRFWLRGTGGNQPFVSGTALLAPDGGNTWYADLAPNGSGAVSGTLYSTSDVTVGGVTGAIWYGMQVYQNGYPGPESPVSAAGNININNPDILSVLPVVSAPTGDSTYLRLNGANSPVTGAVQFQSKITVGLGSPNGTIVSRLDAVLDGSSVNYLTGITSLTPTSYDSMFNGTPQSGAGYAAYTRRIDMGTEAGVDVASSVGLGVFNNSFSTNSTGASTYNNTNQTGLVVNCSALSSSASASVFGANVIVGNLYSGSIPQRQFGVEIDINPTRDSQADGSTLGAWSVGNLITNNSNSAGTCDATIGLLVRGVDGNHGYKIGSFLSGRLCGLALGTESGLTPDAALWVRNATTWGVYIGSRAIESSTYFNSGMTLGNPSVGIELGELGSTSTSSNKLRFTAKDGGSSSLIWDFLASSSGQFLIDLSGSPVVAIQSSALSPGVANSVDLGQTALPWRNLYLGAAATNNIKLTGTSTAARTATLPDNTGTIAELNLAQTWSATQTLTNGILTSAAPAVAASQIGIGSTVASTVGTAGGASALPATPLGYLIINVAGTAAKVPYYNN